MFITKLRTVTAGNRIYELIDINWRSDASNSGESNKHYNPDNTSSRWGFHDKQCEKCPSLTNHNRYQIQPTFQTATWSIYATSFPDLRFDIGNRAQRNCRLI